MFTVANYRASTNRAERRQIQAAIVAECEPVVARVVQEIVPSSRLPKLRETAEQLARLGILFALEQHDPASGETFETTAQTFARTELRDWLDGATYVRKRPTTAAPKDDVASIVDDAEQLALLETFVASLSAEDRAVIRSDDPEQHRSSRYASLIKRAVETLAVAGDSAALRKRAAERETWTKVFATAADKFTALEREAVTAVFFEGRTIAAAAAHLGVNRGTFLSRLISARRRLQRMARA